jgi:hypothetical protein
VRGAGLEEVVVRVVDDGAKDDGTAFFVQVLGSSPDGANDYDLKLKGDVD